MVVFDSVAMNFSFVIVVTVAEVAFQCIRMKIQWIDSLAVELIDVVVESTETNFCAPSVALLVVVVSSWDLTLSADGSWLTVLFVDILEMLGEAVDLTQMTVGLVAGWVHFGS